MRTIALSLVAVATMLPYSISDASARPVRRHVQTVEESVHELPLTVNKRSFLDPGPSVGVGTESRYFEANTGLNQTEDRIRDPDRFGNLEFPTSPYVPGRNVPVAEFATGPRIGDLYSGPIFGFQP